MLYPAAFQHNSVKTTSPMKHLLNFSELHKIEENIKIANIKYVHLVEHKFCKKVIYQNHLQ